MSRNTRVKHPEFGAATVAGHLKTGEFVVCCDNSDDPDLFLVVQPTEVGPMIEPKDVLAEKAREVEALKAQLKLERSNIYSTGIDNFKKALAAAIQSLKNALDAAKSTSGYIRSDIKAAITLADSLVSEYNSGRRF